METESVVALSDANTTHSPKAGSARHSREASVNGALGGGAAAILDAGSLVAGSAGPSMGTKEDENGAVTCASVANGCPVRAASEARPEAMRASLRASLRNTIRVHSVYHWGITHNCGHGTFEVESIADSVSV